MLYASLFAMDEREALIGETQRPYNYSNYLNEVMPFITDATFHPLMVEEDIYTEITQKPSVVMRGDVPLLLGLDDSGNLLHVERSAEIARTIGDFAPEDIYVAAIPVEMMMRSFPQIRARFSQNNSQKLIFSEIEILDDETYQVFQSAARAVGIKVHSLEHPKLHTDASLNLFELNVSLRTEAGQELKTLAGVAEESQRPRSNPEAGDIVVIQGDKLSDDELAELWKLFSTRFTDISDNLPVQLEETQETTRALMTDPSYTFIYARTPYQEIEACVFIADKPDAYPWINADFLGKRESVLRSEGIKEPYGVFIPGIAALRSGRGSIAAGEVLSCFTDLLADMNHQDISVRFECTDVSSRYIPLISMRAARNQPRFTESSIRQIGQKKYVALLLSAV